MRKDLHYRTLTTPTLNETFETRILLAKGRVGFLRSKNAVVDTMPHMLSRSETTAGNE